MTDERTVEQVRLDLESKLERVENELSDAETRIEELTGELDASEAENKEIGDFEDDEIQQEYADRFGEPEPFDAFDEAMDCIAEAARSSRHAARAYQLIRDAYDGVPTLHQRQALIAGRMGEAA